MYFISSDGLPATDECPQISPADIANMLEERIFSPQLVLQTQRANLYGKPDSSTLCGQHGTISGEFMKQSKFRF